MRAVVPSNTRHAYVYSVQVWGVVLLNSAGGLLVAATMKYADNVVKCFATAIAILLGTLLSVSYRVVRTK